MYLITVCLKVVCFFNFYVFYIEIILVFEMYKTPIYKCKIANLYIRTHFPNCCNNCIQRLIYGLNLVEKTFDYNSLLKHVDILDFNEGICLFCCGLLQLDSMCVFMDNLDSNECLLKHILKKIDATKWKYTAYNLQVNRIKISLYLFIL